MLGVWDRWYAAVTDPEPYGDTASYQLGAAYLADCAQIEDWGCGKGWLTKFVEPARYIGIDGSRSRFASRIVDLADYRSDVEGLFMRHVLEHNHAWRQVLDNALVSFTRRMVLVTFTPFGEHTREIAYADDPGVPDISFRLADLTGRFGCPWRSETLEPSATQYGTETIFYLSKDGEP